MSKVLNWIFSLDLPCNDLQYKWLIDWVKAKSQSTIFQSCQDFSQREGEKNEEWDRLKGPYPNPNINENYNKNAVHVMYQCKINPLYTNVLVTPKCVLWQTVKTQMKCHIKWHFIRVYTISWDKNDLQWEKIQLSSENYNLWPLDIHNGSFQVYSIKQEGRIH